MEREKVVLEIAAELGFDLAGIAPLRPPRDADRFDAWLSAGRHGSMDYLARNRDRIVDPRRIQPSGRSLLVVGLAHSRAGVELKGGGRIARYAAGRDYHNVLGKKLKKLRLALAAAGIGGPARAVVDAGPLLERSHAAEAGLGFASKAANLLHPRFGPWFFLGELLLDTDLAPTEAPIAGSCGTCRACLDACPTAAIREPGVVDATLCISYHTIENRGEIPHGLRAALGPWAFGCDVCSEVCPWGTKSPSFAERFGTHPWIGAAGLVEWLLAGPSLSARLEGSPLRRPGRAGLARNAAIALGNQPSDEGRRGLLHALTFDPAALVREAAASALAAGHGEEAGVRSALERAATAEHEPAVRGAIEASRARCADGS